MHFIKIFIFIGLSLVVGLFGCTKEEKKVEGSQTGANHKELGSPEV